MDSGFQYDPPTEPWLQIIHEDRDIVVLDKPSGLLSVPGRIHKDSALNRVLAQQNHAYAVHRLDMDTSGLLIIALRRNAERELQRQFRERLVDKSYVAVVWGAVSDAGGEIDLPLSRLPGQPPRSVVDREQGRPASTRYQVLSRDADRTRLRLFPHTGRSHQLRVHLSAIGHPIIGDRFYGDTPETGRRLHLHAESIQIAHPYTGHPLRLEAPTPF